jgi:hypothetical protein
MNAQAQTVAQYIEALNNAFDARVAFEASKSKDASSNIAHTLHMLRKEVTQEKTASVLQASYIDADFINRSIRADARLNVYAAQKYSNVARTIAKVETLNHYTRAILKTAQAFAQAELQMTSDDAKSACTLDMKVKDAKREKLISKYAKHIAVSTANTQSSSSLDALVAFDVLKRSKNDANETIYIVNNDSANTQALLAAL